MIALGTFVYGILPKLDDGELSNRQVWAVISIDLLAGALIAAAPFVTARVSARPRMLAAVTVSASAPAVSTVGVVLSSSQPTARS